jgi:hypothetical protein
MRGIRGFECDIALDLREISEEKDSISLSSWWGHSIDLLIIDESAFLKTSNGHVVILKSHYKHIISSILQRVRESIKELWTTEYLVDMDI